MKTPTGSLNLGRSHQPCRIALNHTTAPQRRGKWAMLHTCGYAPRLVQKSRRRGMVAGKCKITRWSALGARGGLYEIPVARRQPRNLMRTRRYGS